MERIQSEKKNMLEPDISDELKLEVMRTQEDSNLRGRSPVDFKSTPLTTPA